MRLVVLGWDALDHRLIDKYGLNEQFGPTSEIDTYVNPVVDEPHTRELWPSIITGFHPNNHGIQAVSESGGVDWNNSAIDYASTVANGLVPQVLLSAIGNRLRERGAGLDVKRTEYYKERGIETVFDDRGKPISIPNYETDYDREFDLDANRDDVWATLLADRDGSEGFEPNVAPENVYSTVFSEASRRVAHTLSATQRGNELVWTWFGLLDTAGHVDPAVEYPLQRMAYELAATYTQMVKRQVGSDTEVLCISDHGLIGGDHTHYATVAGGPDDAHESIDSVFDVADWIRSQELQSDTGLSDSTEYDMETVNEQLEKLGYI